MVEHPSYFSRTSPLFRVAYCHFFHDLTLLQEARPGALLALLATTGAAGGCAALADVSLGSLPAGVDTITRAGLLLRWAAGGFKFGSSMFILDGVYRLPLLCFGKTVPSALQNPFASTTVREFWGRRWNQVIGGMLRDGIFMPCRKRGYRNVGVALTFLGSGVLHVVPMLLSGQPRDVCVTVFAFFALQIVVLAVERRLGLSGVAWVWLALCSGAPLFVEPFLRCFEEKAAIGGGGVDHAPTLTQTLLFFYGARDGLAH